MGYVGKKFMLHYMITAFNSLYGIPFLLCFLPLSLIFYFQFPLWDTEGTISGDDEVLDFNFQFPLWDTFMGYKGK